MPCLHFNAWQVTQKCIAKLNERHPTIAILPSGVEQQLSAPLLSIHDKVECMMQSLYHSC
jgi:hypothetical protein